MFYVQNISYIWGEFKNETEMDTLRNYRNSVRLNFENRGENFTLNVPHYGKWIEIIDYLEKRGWTVGENEYYKKTYFCLTDYHKIGFKKDMVCLMEISSAFISVEFGNKRNLWKDCPQSLWSDPSDERFSKLSYLESSAVNLEIFKLIKFCNQWDFSFTRENDDLSPKEYILHKLKVNSHIHGKVECLKDIAIDMEKDNYNSQHNNNDKNKKKIICGDIKYFYDRQTKRLFCGEVWHNINNMWWVIYGGTLRNVCSADLFDFNPLLTRRQQPTKSEVDSILKKYESLRDYKRCEAIYKHHLGYNF